MFDAQNIVSVDVDSIDLDVELENILSFEGMMDSVKKGAKALWETIVALVKRVIEFFKRIFSKSDAQDTTVRDMEDSMAEFDKNFTTYMSKSKENRQVFDKIKERLRKKYQFGYVPLDAQKKRFDRLELISKAALLNEEVASLAVMSLKSNNPSSIDSSISAAENAIKAMISGLEIGNQIKYTGGSLQMNGVNIKYDDLKLIPEEAGIKQISDVQAVLKHASNALRGPNNAMRGANKILHNLDRELKSLATREDLSAEGKNRLATAKTYLENATRLYVFMVVYKSQLIKDLKNTYKTTKAMFSVNGE